MNNDLCQYVPTPLERVSAERERNRRFWEGKSYTPQNLRISNVTMTSNEPWVLFSVPARVEGEDHSRYPSKIGNRSVYLHEWGPRC